MRQTRAITAIGAAFFLVTGLWAFVSPHSFYEVVATYPPFNEHLFHDLGAFQIGLGVTAAVALVSGNGLTVALAGVSSGAVLHSVAHFLDRDHGGRSTDPWALGLLALLLVTATLVHLKGRSA